ncbi:hypothetical protein llg_17770 [Luteolibacter sp. LG18]|nr:hypothetical protein llg_17770 [Luteolibacter sp. LG18]
MENAPGWGMRNESERKEGHFPPSPFQMDFENYTLGRLVPDRGNYDYEHEGYKITRSQVLWRIDQLGWFENDLNKIDLEISRAQNWSRSDNDPRKVDRYGKKYSWVAYFEMSGLLHDNGVIDRTYDRGRTSDVDIDPSFPDKVLKAVFFDADLLGAHEMTTADWISAGEKIDMDPYLKAQAIGGQEGPWITLDGFVVQQDEGRGRRAFCFVRSFMVEAATSKEFLDHLTRQNLEGRWLPEKPSVIYTFGGEIPWCATYPGNEPVEFSFVEEEKIIKVQKTMSEFYLDGQKVNFSPLDLMRRKMFGLAKHADKEDGLSQGDIERVEVREGTMEVEELQQKFVDYIAAIPVCDFGWEGYHSVTGNAGHAVALEKKIANDLGLVSRAQEFDLFSKDGTRATLNISDHRDDYNNHQSFFFLKEDLLRSYLEERELVLVWAVWGEREYSAKQVEALFHGANRPAVTHGNIKHIDSYNSDRGLGVDF